MAFPSSPTNGQTYSVGTTKYVFGSAKKIVASDAEISDNFGDSVSISSDGNTAIVGAPQEDTSPKTDNGAAYVFTRSGGVWTQQQKLTASDLADDDQFGNSVAISADGNTVIVGAIGVDTSPNTINGAAYVFTRSGGVWTQQAKLLASDRQTADLFGASVSISSDGNTAIVGAYAEDTSPRTNNGAAYVFTRSGSTWTEQQKLIASDYASTDTFGWSVAISSDGNTAIVGSIYQDTSPNTDNGAAYVFTRSGSTWTEQQKLIASDAANNHNFGISVSISSDGNTAIVGATQVVAVNNGAAYVFTRSGGVWTQQQKLTASDGAMLDAFGSSVVLSLDGNTALIGAQNEDTSPKTDNGAAYVFTRSGGVWTQQQKLTASDAETSNQFGYSVALSSDGLIAIVGALAGDGIATNQGVAYSYNFGPTGNRWEIVTSTTKKAPTTYLFTSSVSSWTIPTNARVMHIVCIGAGGGGGSGAYLASSTPSGGSGGTGGQMTEATYNLISGYNATAVITIGAGGAGGAAKNSVGTGNNASNGGHTSVRLGTSSNVGTLLAYGGTAGNGGASGSASGMASTLGMYPSEYSGYGNFGGGGDATSSGGAAGSGGGGGGSSTGSGDTTGGKGGGCVAFGIAQTSNAAANTNGSNGGTTGKSLPGGGGGGAGGSSTTGGYIGGAGGLYGGAGGGGGGFRGTGTGSGAGGAGAQGCVFITIWYE